LEDKMAYEETTVHDGNETGKAEATLPKDHSHEKAVITAVISVAIIIALGILLAIYLKHVFSAKPPKLETQDYNNFVFTKNSETSWITKWERDNLTYTLEFRHPPWEVENITVTGAVDWRFQKPYVFVTFDPTEGESRETAFVALAAHDVSAMLPVFLRTPIAACTQNLTEACSTRDIVTCSTNASVIYLKTSNETGIFLDGNCATFQGMDEGITMAADKALYQWLGIIKK